jgi:hypothetical protein
MSDQHHQATTATQALSTVTLPRCFALGVRVPQHMHPQQRAWPAYYEETVICTWVCSK